ncbi:MAG: Mov34/MPN/PAD-1 family protein [Bacteroidales bacterium]|nr:Mov34/MPN/PAD-1 family protein [Bacteroidales bacterium]
MIKMKEKDFKVEFDDVCIEELKKYQQKNGEYESGGILMGEIYPNKNKVVVRKVVVSKNATRSFMGVNIDKKEMQVELEKVRKETEYEYYYIGDWHTHPEKIPTPSWIDKRSYKKTLKKIVLQTNFVVFLIVGNGDDIMNSLWIKTYFLAPSYLK